MVKWDAVTMPTIHGGLGIYLDIRRINECLLVKWIWKIYKQPEDIWCKILRAKYMQHGDLFRSKETRGSQF